MYVCAFFFFLNIFFTALVNKKKALLRPHGKGAQVEGCCMGEGAGGGPYLTFFLGCRLLVWPHFLWLLPAWGCWQIILLQWYFWLNWPWGSLIIPLCRQSTKCRGTLEDRHEGWRGTATEPGPSTSVAGQGPPISYKPELLKCDGDTTSESMVCSTSRWTQQPTLPHRTSISIFHTLIRNMMCRYFLPFSGFSFYYVDNLLLHKFLISMKSNCLFFSFVACAFGVIAKESLPNPMSWGFWLVFV